MLYPINLAETPLSSWHYLDSAIQFIYLTLFMVLRIEQWTKQSLQHPRAYLLGERRVDNQMHAISEICSGMEQKQGEEGAQRCPLCRALPTLCPSSLPVGSRGFYTSYQISLWAPPLLPPSHPANQNILEDTYLFTSPTAETPSGVPATCRQNGIPPYSPQ